MPLWGFSNGTKNKKRKEKKKRKEEKRIKIPKILAATFAAAKPPAQRRSDQMIIPTSHLGIPAI